MPVLKEAADARKAMGSIVVAVADGELTPSEATSIGKLSLIVDFVAIDADTEADRRARERKKNGSPLAFDW